jgi:hypothetical protein
VRGGGEGRGIKSDDVFQWRRVVGTAAIIIFTVDLL